MKARRILLVTALPLLAGVPPTHGETAVAVTGLHAPQVSRPSSGSNASAIETALVADLGAPDVRSHRGS